MPIKDDIQQEEGIDKRLFERELLNRIANMLANEDLLRPDEQIRFMHFLNEEES